MDYLKGMRLLRIGAVYFIFGMVRMTIFVFWDNFAVSVIQFGDDGGDNN